MNRTITVKGVGEVRSKPDLAVIPISINVRTMEYEKTMTIASELLDTLRHSLETVSFGKDDLKTQSYNVRPVFENERDTNGNYKSVFKGYECAHSMKLEFDLDMARLAKTMGVLALSKAKPVFSVNFKVKDEDALIKEMLINATANAKSKAETLCAAAGVSLGQLLSLDYNWGEIDFRSDTSFDISKNCMPMECDALMELVPDDIDTSDTATFVWEIQ